jgi:hypothetical protein
MTTATTGTGTITLASAKAGYFTFAEGGVANADTVTYVIVDCNDFEIGTGTYTPNSSRKYINAAASGGARNEVSWSGCLFEVDVEKPTIPNRNIIQDFGNSFYTADIASFGDYADDAAAATAGVPVGGAIPHSVSRKDQGDMMWTHYCPVDRGWISVGHKEPCNWCGQHEPKEKECKPRS